jgi:type IV pilus assembly protein PilP
MKRKSDIIAAAIVLIFFLIFGGPYCTAIADPPVNEQAVQAPDYHYNPAGKTDPFRPFVEKELVLKKKTEKTTASIFPLQRADIDQFNLVGIGGDTKRRIAIVEPIDIKGRSYPVMVGTVIGLNNGKVVDIKYDMIVIEEAIKGSARHKVNRITKKLHKNEEEGTP